MPFVTLVEQIAEQLGEGWSAQPGYWDNDNDAKLLGPDGVELHLVTGGYQRAGRIEISGSFTREEFDHIRYDEPHRYEITVSADKAPARIAGDIRRRLLPAFTAALPIIRERVERSRQGEAAREQLHARLAGILPSVHAIRDGLRFGHYEGLHGDVEVRHGAGSVKFELFVPGELAPELAEFIAQLKRR